MSQGALEPRSPYRAIQQCATAADLLLSMWFIFVCVLTVNSDTNCQCSGLFVIGNNT